METYSAPSMYDPTPERVSRIVGLRDRLFKRASETTGETVYGRNGRNAEAFELAAKRLAERVDVGERRAIVRDLSKLEYELRDMSWRLDAFGKKLTEFVEKHS